MATTAKTIVPEKAKPKGRKPISEAHKAKRAAGLARWRSEMTDEEREAWKAQNGTTQKQRWENMSERERKDRMAGMKAWQAEQRPKKRAAAKPKAAPKVDPKAAPRNGSRRTEVSERTARKGTTKPLAESTRPMEADLELEVIGPDGSSKPSADSNVLANPNTQKGGRSK